MDLVSLVRPTLPPAQAPSHPRTTRAPRLGTPAYGAAGTARAGYPQLHAAQTAAPFALVACAGCGGRLEEPPCLLCLSATASSSFGWIHSVLQTQDTQQASAVGLPSGQPQRPLISALGAVP